MATQCTIKVPFSRIIKMGIWSNQAAKTTLNKVYTQLQSKYPGKEIYISNAGFFDMSSKIPAIWGCKADGVVYANDWSTTAYMAMKGNSIVFCKAGSAFPAGYTDGVSVYPALIENGKKSPKYHTYPDGTSNRGRTMIGYTNNELVLSCIADVSGNSDFTIAEEYTYMLNQGCVFAGNLDGGGSSQCNFNGSKITSPRIVSNFFYVVVEPSKPVVNPGTGSSTTTNYKKNVQCWLNATYNAGLVVDGSLGPLTLKAIIKGMQKECGTDADGSWGPKSKKAYKVLKYGGPNNTPNKIKLLQCALCRKGYWTSNLTGTFDTALKNQVMLYQRAYRLAVDGMVGPDTITSLFT